MLRAGQAQVTHHMQAVAAAGGPAVHQCDHHLGHEADEPLDLQNVQPTHRCRTCVVWFVALRVRIAAPTPDPLITAAAECPATVLRRRPVAGQEHRAYVGRAPRVVECSVEFVDGMRPEGVTHLGSVERHSYHRQADRAMVSDVTKFKAGHCFPQARLKRSGHVSPGRRTASWSPLPSSWPHWRQVVGRPYRGQLWPRRLAASEAPDSPLIACLVAEYAIDCGLGTWAEIDPLLMIRPPRGTCRRICPKASRVQRNAPVRLTATQACQSAKLIVSRSPLGPPVPALLKSRSSRPCRSTVVRNNSRTDSSSVTSVGTASSWSSGWSWTS